MMVMVIVLLMTMLVVVMMRDDDGDGDSVIDDDVGGGAHGGGTDGHYSQEDKTVYSSYAARQQRKLSYKTWSERALTGLEVPLASRGTRLAFEGPHWDLPTYGVNSLAFPSAPAACRLSQSSSQTEGPCSETGGACSPEE